MVQVLDQTTEKYGDMEEELEEDDVFYSEGAALVSAANETEDEVNGEDSDFAEEEEEDFS